MRYSIPALQLSVILALFFLDADAPPYLRNLARENLVTIKDSPRTSACKPKEFSYEFNAVAKPEAIQKYGCCQRYLAAYLGAGGS